MANMIVSGAGSSEVNGTYVEFETYKNKPYYSKDDFELKWEGLWVFTDFMEGDDYYYSFDDVDTPDLCTTWSKAAGALPVPTVTKEEEPQPTGVPKHYLYYARLRGN